MKIKLLFISILIFVSCNSKNSDYKRFKVIDFSKKRIDTLKPIKNKSYVAYYIKVKGFTNDTVRITSKSFYDIKLTGKIDTVISSDYYGEDMIILSFEPYKAKKGKLEIEYSL